eukprot:TRINITY_DN5234_c0_g2_i2.p1 TRINITY_DN5234_c0_g2~~TRINITY_DN5234_c0_g2_i2.p1  ORF type:complete len:301 (-),score=56.10 TRINITY_DN5234_c0_g2_i2:38-940(-)
MSKQNSKIVIEQQALTERKIRRVLQSHSPRRSRIGSNANIPKLNMINTAITQKELNSSNKSKKSLRSIAKAPLNSSKAKKPYPAPSKPKDPQESFLFEEVKVNIVKATLHTLRSSMLSCFPAQTKRLVISCKDLKIELLGHKEVVDRVKEYLCFKDYLSFLLVSKKVYTKKRIRKKIEQVLAEGITQGQRAEYWTYKCGLNNFARERIYEMLKEQQQSLTYEMEEDIDRMFDTRNPFLSFPHNKVKLENVLKAFLAKHRDIGYIQGINFIAGKLLQKFNESVNLVTVSYTHLTLPTICSV